MADHAGDHLDYWVATPAAYAHALYPLRKWPNLKMATTDGMIWLRGLSRANVESVNVLSIPMIDRYYLVDANLYPIGKSLPALVVPNLLWTDLRRGLQIKLPKENFNYFGVAQTHPISLVPSDVQRATTASVVDLVILGAYLHTAPRVRVASLQWTVLEGKYAMIMGTPLLPIQGQDYYHQACFLIPIGYKLRYERMAGIYQAALGDGHEYWYILSESSDLSKLRKADFNSLSKGSFVNTSKLR